MNHSSQEGTQIQRIGPGLIDTSEVVPFIFNDQKFYGHAGDTLASAMLANGQRLVGRSFKYHRPRGIFSAGSEEPNALVELGIEAYKEPNTRATVTELYPYLEARSQNHRGPLTFDFMAINDRLSAFLGAGFYYKTFMWPKAFWEKLYEPVIRASAGLGKLSGLADPDAYDKGFLHTDLLIIGAGAAGITSALNAGRSGLRVILADEDFLPGGQLNCDDDIVDGLASSAWARQSIAELKTMSNVRLMTRTSVYGAFDHGVYGALERKTDHLPLTTNQPRQVLWRIYSKQCLLSAGSTERSIAFGNNDRPGIMLSASVRTYVNRYGVAPGNEIAIFTNNDDGWRTAADCRRAGIKVVAVVDPRSIAPFELGDVPVYLNSEVVDTEGRLGLSAISIRDNKRDETHEISADCLAVSGGWNPNVHLTCHQRGRPVWNDDILAFVPGGELPTGMSVAGAANGHFDLSATLQSSLSTSSALIKELGAKPAMVQAPETHEKTPYNIEAFWHVKAGKQGGQHRAWIDLQNDVTTKDINISHQDGFRATEHLKRYTTLGMATDQGKTSNVLGLAIMAEVAGKTIAETGTTIFRPPYTPVPIGAFGGRSRGKEFKPTRVTPSHAWAAEQNAEFVEVGPWLRAQWYPKNGETFWRDSVDREVLQTRSSVGICDVTTLGKIDIQGSDAAAFLDKVYANTFSTLAVGKVRYGLMLREDGIAMDDGTTARFSETHFVMTTTTANAVSVFRHMEFCRQCLWPDMDVHLISATDQWAQYAVAGPNARKLLAKIVDKPFDIGNEAFPFMACSELSICNGAPARLFRISFSGELAYEIAVPARYGDSLMRTLMIAGDEFQVVPYGTEALGVMRIEKGHAAGNELNGQTTALNIGLGRMVSKKKDSIGSVLSERSGLNQEDALSLVGFKPVDNTRTLRAGAHFIAEGAEMNMDNDEGWMTSVCYSPNLQTSIGIGYLKRGQDRIGETIRAADPLRGEDIEVQIVSPHFIDPKGDRLRA